MTWVAWRQLQLPAVVGALCLGLLALFLLVTGLEMSSAFRSNGLADCLATRQSCGLLGEQFRQRFGALVAIAPYFQFLPGLLGVFLAAPLVAREYERGTHRLVFTQTVTRLRWITVKLALLLALSVVASVGMARLVSWWYEPLARLDSGRFTPEVFSHEGIAPLGYAVFAVALGVAAGTALRRTVPAMALTIVVFFAVRFPVEQWLRPRYLSPSHLTHPAAVGFGTGHGNWDLSSTFVDGLGRALPMQHVATACPPGSDTGLCLEQHGFRVLETFQPAGRFWLFQGIETGIFLSLAVLLIAATVQRLRRRPD